MAAKPKWDDGKPLRDAGELVLESLRLRRPHCEPELVPQPSEIPSPPGYLTRRVLALDRYLCSRAVQGIVRRSDVYWICRQLISAEAAEIRTWLLNSYIGRFGRTLVEVGGGKLRFRCPPPPRQYTGRRRRIRVKRPPFCWPPVS